MIEKHPHGRGEEKTFAPPVDNTSETPPRAWGRDLLSGGAIQLYRNTPTGVGKTGLLLPPVFAFQKHPHGRGEDDFSPVALKSELETPPRAWGRLSFAAFSCSAIRNTPTGVGKTFLKASISRLLRKHPHGRGEDVMLTKPMMYFGETPPRAWGRLYLTRIFMPKKRNTPTGVGKTPDSSRPCKPFWKHPHGRGEDPMPPAGRKRQGGNTPTGVGKTCRLFLPLPACKKHPHGRGEDGETGK